MKEKKILNTLAKRTLVTLIAVNLVIFTVTNVCIPQLFYRYLKEEAVVRKRAEVEALGVRSELSFLNYLNFENSKAIAHSNKMRKALREGNREEAKTCFGQMEIVERKIYEAVAIYYNGEVYPVYGQSAGVQNILDGAWFEEYLNSGHHSRMKFDFSEETTKLTGLHAWEVDGERYDIISIMEIGKYDEAIRSFEELGIEDVMIYYRPADEIVYQFLPLEKTAIDCESLTESAKRQEMPHDIQIEEKDGYHMAMACDFVESREAFYVFYHLSRNQLLEDYAFIFRFIRYIMLIAFGSSAVLVFFILNRNMKNIKKLSTEMNKVRKGDYEVQTKFHTGDEIQELGETFDLMVSTLKENIRKIAQQEKRESEIKYALMVSEINPHFIYNTLNTITYLAALKQNDDILKVNHALISLLKDRLKLKEFKSFDTVRNEIDLNNHYMEIQKHQHSDKVVLVWDVEPEMMDREIPKNILLPLIENALLHGMYEKKDEEDEIIGGEVHVKIWEENGHLFLRVRDSGGGMDENTLKKYFGKTDKMEFKEGEHIGIRNIRFRLAYLYGTRYELTAKSKAGEGTEILVCLQSDSQNQNGNENQMKRQGEETEKDGIGVIYQKK